MDNLDYIESYFTHAMVPGQAREFEKRIESDPAFAEDVAFYLSARQVSRETSLADKKNHFKAIYRQYVNEKIPVKAPVRKLLNVYYMTAAAVVAGIIIGIYVFTSFAPPQQLADQYIKDNLQTIGVTMSSRSDSLQTGLQLYNDGKFTEALSHFEKMLQSDSSIFTAREYAGVAALRLKDYNKALSYFEQLETFNRLYANPALILQSVTLMERNQPGDAARAKTLLKKIVDQDLEGRESAQLWLKKM